MPLTSKLLEALREYWRWKKPRVYLFPSKMSDPGVEQPISDKTVWNICRAPPLAPHSEEARPAYPPALLRHTPVGGRNRSAHHHLLMGHERLEDTTIYLHLSQRHLHAAINPLDQLTLRSAPEDQRG